MNIARSDLGGLEKQNLEGSGFLFHPFQYQSYFFGGYKTLVTCLLQDIGVREHFTGINWMQNRGKISGE